MTMRVPTAIGTLAVETEWAPLLHFLELQVTPFPPAEKREVLLRVETAPAASIDLSRVDPPEACPRRVAVEHCLFTLSPDAITGVVPSDLPQVGLVLAWLWYALAVCCAPAGWEAVHAAAVESDEGATLLFGASRGGKTHHALRLMQGGHHYLSDDVVLLSADGRLCRGWGANLSVEPQVARELGTDVQHLDWSGKVRVRPPQEQRRAQAPVVRALLAGEGACSVRHSGPGWESAWIRDYGAGERWLRQARRAPSDRLDVRIALVNRDPEAAVTRFDGGDLTNLYGYRDGLRALGVQADFVPWDLLDETRYDLIHLFHAQFPWSHAVAKSTTKPLVVQAITQGDPGPAAVEAAVARAAAVLCYSRLEEDWYGARFPNLPRARFITVPQGVPPELYAQPELPRVDPSVLYAGRYCEIKNQLGVAWACKALDVPVTFCGFTDAGQGEYVRALRREAGSWRGMRFFGALKGTALWREYRRAHVHVQPSMWESFGLATWEALAAGCNVVLTSRGFGAPLVAPHGTICEPDAESIRDAIRRELGRPRDWHRFRPPTWRGAARALLPVYRRALG